MRNSENSVCLLQITASYDDIFAAEEDKARDYDDSC